jgi:hypothetical protein
VIARREIPERYQAWNRAHRAPEGRKRGVKWVRRIFGGDSNLTLRYVGEYAHQWNNDTRVFEYPYAFEKIVEHAGPGAHLLELGGGLSGLQFTLARTGRRVVNVDPGPARGWPLDVDLHRRIGRALRAPVELHPDVLSTYRPAGRSPDLVYSVSALEHFSPSDLTETSSMLRCLLAPGAVVVMTADLFPDLSPFTARTSNESGTNIDLASFLSDAGLTIVEGDQAELCGFPEFSPERILERLQELYLGRPYPALIQCVVARRTE